MRLQARCLALCIGPGETDDTFDILKGCRYEKPKFEFVKWAGRCFLNLIRVRVMGFLEVGIH